jgi:hypothetical protein
MGSREGPFSLPIDQYGRLFILTKQDGIQIAFDLAGKDLAFDIMAAAMSDADAERRPGAIPLRVPATSCKLRRAPPMKGRTRSLNSSPLAALSPHPQHSPARPHIRKST